MRVVHQTRLDPEKLHSVLEASCDALMMLQSMEPGADPRNGSVAHQHLREAAEALRCAIAELRRARSEDACVVGLGFVVDADSRLPPRR